MKNVLVTGANGHVGYNLTSLLVENGYKVRASVRDVNDPAKTAYLKPLGVELAKVDLLRPESFRAAMKGMDGVFHVAAGFQFFSKHPEKEVLEATVSGMIYMLEAAREQGVKKVVITSSVAAVGNAKPGAPDRTENDWNENPIDYYLQAKTEAERKGMAFAEANGMNVVAINPSIIIGPGFHRHTPSTTAFGLLLDGKIPLALPINLNFVDVRDVARAHLLAYENEQAAGRYIVAGECIPYMEALNLMRDFEPPIKIPRRVLPKWLLGITPFLDWAGHKATGQTRLISRNLIKELAQGDPRFSSQKIMTELGWEPRPLRDSLADTIEWIREKLPPI